MHSRLSQIGWKQTREFRVPSAPLAAEALESSLAKLLDETGLPDLHGTAFEKTIELLRMAAEVEHAFVVQYLYGAFSLDQTDPNGRAWYPVLFGIAKEEMGHLVTVQNLLALLGQHPHLDRQSYPAPPSYPFEKVLKKFALDWLGDFVIAESPMGAKLPPGLPPAPHMERVGTIYMNLYWLFKKSEEPGLPWPIANPGFPPEHLEDSDFVDPGALTDVLMSPDDWHVAPEPPGGPTAGLRILGHGPFDSRDAERAGALGAIYDVAAQGEGPIPQANSHFDRLSRIYTAASPLAAKLPVQSVVDNPHTKPETSGNPEGEIGLITHPLAVKLAGLANLRYGMLLTEIGQAAQTKRSVVVNGESVRGTLTDWAVSNEMFFLHQISDWLNVEPLKALKIGGSDTRASAPFELPSKLPSNDRDRWQSYLNVFDQTRAIASEVGSSVAGISAITDADDARRAFIADQLRHPK